MGPRRTTLALTLLALGLLVASAGTAMASSVGHWSSRPPTAPTGGAAPVAGAERHHLHDGRGWADNAHHLNGGSGGWNHDDVDPTPDPNGNGQAPGGIPTGGDVTGTSVDTPSAPVQAPAATASGPAPDAVAPAPIGAAPLAAVAPMSAATGADLAAVAAVDEVAPPAVAAPAAAAAVPVDEPSLAGLPVLGSIGSLAPDVPDAPSTARALLTTRTGRSVAVLLALLAAIALFLAIHRRVDRSDPKLASARTGPDVARFR